MLLQTQTDDILKQALSALLNITSNRMSSCLFVIHFLSFLTFLLVFLAAYVEAVRRNGGMRDLVRLLDYNSNSAEAIVPLTLMVCPVLLNLIKRLMLTNHSFFTKVLINLAGNEKNMEVFGELNGFSPLIRLLHHPIFGVDAMSLLVHLIDNGTY